MKTPKLLRLAGLAACLALIPAVRGAAGAGEPAGPPAGAAESEAVRASGYIRVFQPDEAAASVGRDEGRDAARPGALSMLARTGFWLGLILVALCGVVVLARRFMPRSMSMFKSPAMELMGRSYLDPKRCVYLLKVGGRVLVVGGAENGLTCLSEISDQAEVRHLAALAASPGPARSAEPGRFAAALGRSLGGLAGRPAARSSEPAGIPPGTGGRSAAATGSNQQYPPVPARSRPVDQLDELREKVEGLKARLRAIS
jgi:flagellar biogenesis protein FliO